MIPFLILPLHFGPKKIKKWVNITILEALFAKVREPSKKLSPLLRWGQWHPNSATDLNLKYVVTGSYQSTLSPNDWLLNAMRSCWGRLSTNFFRGTKRGACLYNKRIPLFWGARKLGIQCILVKSSSPPS